MQNLQNKSFLDKITEIIENNISDEKFGVSELANEVGMSRSNLLRKVQKLSSLSVSQFIRQVRLRNAMEILKEGTSNVSEVSYKVGFSSTSYFIKCFREHYGYPPGEVGKEGQIEEMSAKNEKSIKVNIKLLITSAVSIIVLVFVFFVLVKPFLNRQGEIRKSIAILPFRNDSNDSTNIYFINGLMESVLTNLQKIEDLDVISRTSVEKYRSTTKSIKTIGKELDVYYIVEGSGQKIGNKVLLNIQLIDAENDKHLWAEQYNNEDEDIFQLQLDIAKSIASEIQVIITPEEELHINKLPTSNLEAYDLYLRGLDLFYQEDIENYNKAIDYYKGAIELDPEFARAYAGVAICYYFMDVFQVNKKYIDELNEYAEKAILLDPNLEQSLIAKALSYMINGRVEQAVPYLEKAININPNSSTVLNILSDIYATKLPNTAKYLEYALRGIKLDIARYDSTNASLIYLHVSNALIQSGFVDEAEMYINKSLDYDSNNIYSMYVRAYILFAKNRKLKQTEEILISTLKKDTTRIDVLQELAKIYYYQRDFESSYRYYRKFLEIKRIYNLGIYASENGKIGTVYKKMGYKHEADSLLEEYRHYAEKDRSIYKNLSLAMYYASIGEIEKSLENFKKFSNEENYFYWIPLFLKIDPMVDNLNQNNEFKLILDQIDTKFWDRHKQLKTELKRQKLI